jgi:hypothetical protein
MFNLGEIGISDLEECKTNKVIHLGATFRQAIHHGVSRNVKHISVIAYLSAAGESLFHYIMTSQNAPTRQKHLKKQGVRFRRDFALKFNQNTYFNARIFLAFITTILLPYIDTFRGWAVLAQEIALLLMDHCSADVSDNVIRILTRARVRVITFALRTTQVFQVPDLTVFAILKRSPRYELPFCAFSYINSFSRYRRDIMDVRLFFGRAISWMSVLWKVTVSFVQNGWTRYRSSRTVGRGIVRPERLESNVFRPNKIR